MVFVSKSIFVAFPYLYLIPLIVLIGSWIALNSNVPTVVDGRSGVKRKWFLGEINVTSNFDFEMSLLKLKPPHPDPRTTVLGLPE